MYTYTYIYKGENLEIMLHGVTPRGPEITTPRGFEAAVQVAAGHYFISLYVYICI
jgi:hypothetical protein